MVKEPQKVAEAPAFGRHHGHILVDLIKNVHHQAQKGCRRISLRLRSELPHKTVNKRNPLLMIANPLNLLVMKEEWHTCARINGGFAAINIRRDVLLEGIEIVTTYLLRKEFLYPVLILSIDVVIIH